MAQDPARWRARLIMWVVDSNLLLDLVLDDPVFQAASRSLLIQTRRRGLVACPVTLVEIAPSFGGDVPLIQEFLEAFGVSTAEGWTDQDTATACGAWTRLVSQKRNRSAAKRPIADILIGAYAERFDGLLTRNGADFRGVFPSLKIESP